MSSGTSTSTRDGNFFKVDVTSVPGVSYRPCCCLVVTQLLKCMCVQQQSCLLHPQSKWLNRRKLIFDRTNRIVVENDSNWDWKWKGLGRVTSASGLSANSSGPSACHEAEWRSPGPPKKRSYHLRKRGLADRNDWKGIDLLIRSTEPRIHATLSWNTLTYFGICSSPWKAILKMFHLGDCSSLHGQATKETNEY